MRTLLFTILLLFTWMVPVFAAVTSSTEVVTIQDGRSKRATASEIVAAVNDAGLSSAIKTTSGVGAVSGTGVSAVEYGDGTIHSTVLTFEGTEITVRDTEQGGGVLAYTFPEGRILVLGATGTMSFTTTSALATTLNASASSRWGVGTVTQSNATLATTEQDLIAVATFAASATIDVANTAVGSALAASAQFDGTSTEKEAYLNVSVPEATDIDADATVEANGTVTISWINLGDY